MDHDCQILLCFVLILNDPTLCNRTEAFRFDAIFVVPPPPPVDDAVRVDCLEVFLGFFGILDNFFNNVYKRIKLAIFVYVGQFAWPSRS